MTKFTTGAYKGMTHEEVAKADPKYLITLYEQHWESGRVSREIYRKAVEVLHKNDMSDAENWEEQGLDFDSEAVILAESFGTDEDNNTE